MCDGVEACKAEAALQETEEPGDAVGPASVVNERTVDKGAGLVGGRSTGEDSDGDDGEAEEGPDEGAFGNEG